MPFYLLVYRQDSFVPVMNVIQHLCYVAGSSLEVPVWTSQVLNYSEMEKPVDGLLKPLIISLLPFTDSSLRLLLAVAFWGMLWGLYSGKWYLSNVIPQLGREMQIFVLRRKGDPESDF